MSKKESVNIVVEGFCFTDEEEGEQAKREREGIKYIKGRTDMDNPEMVLQIYNKMIEEKLFETAVGHAYLKELQEYLRTMPFINNEDIKAIPVRHPKLEAGIKKERQKHQKHRKDMADKLKAAKRGNDAGKMGEKYKASLYVNLILAVCVVLMFIISMTSKNPTILNYESKLVDRYAAWEQELIEREQLVKEREQELDLSGGDE